MQKQTQNNDTVIEILEMNPFEMELIHSIRNRWRFGEITIIVKDGVPVRLKRVFEFIDLDKKD
jgi:hypothetical protein